VSLNLTVPLGANETPASFASRLAASHRLPAREFCLDWGLRFQSVVDGNAEAIAKIASLGDASAETLMTHAFVRTQDRSYTHRGQRLVRQVLRRSRIHVCPACLKADIEDAPTLAPAIAPYHRAAWLIEVIKTCPAHRIALVEIADDLTPGGLHDFAFHVAPAVSRLDAMIDAAKRRDPSDLETYVLRRLDGTRTSPFLDGLDLYVAIRFCEMIGAVEVFGRTANLNRLNDDQWWRAGARGFAIAAGGAPAIGEFLSKLQNTYSYGRRGNAGPQALFGRLYQWLEFGAEHPAYDPVRAVVGRHIRDSLPVGPGDLIFGCPVEKRAQHSIRSLSTESGLHFKRLRKLLLGAGLIGGRQTTLADNIVVFDAKAADAVVAKAKGALALPTAGKYLNAPRVHIRLLAKRRFIQPCVPAAKFSANDQYAPADLDAFLRRLLAGAHIVRKPKPNQMSIPAAAKRTCCSAADILRLILDRKLDWVGQASGQRGYLSVRVDIDEIRHKVRGADHGGLTPRQVASMIGSAEKVIGPLVKARKLTTRTVINPINRCPQVVIMPNEVAAFQRRYVSLFALAKERRKHFKAVKNELNAAGVEPAFKPKKIGATFYWRRDC
jgi:hypothetical protein